MTMPALHDYNSQHLRNGSSSQMSLPDQLDNAINNNASQSLTFLPATAYRGPKIEGVPQDNQHDSPDAFYQQYTNQYAQPAGSSLRQGAIKTLEVNASENGRPQSAIDDSFQPFQNGGSTTNLDHNRSHVSSPGIRGRKNSVKNLVEQYNASTVEELPPVPVNPGSRNGSRNVSPVISSQARSQQANPSRQLFNNAVPPRRQDPDSRQKAAGNMPNHASQAARSMSSENSAQNQRPLFGEVVPSSSNLEAPGYGIQNFRNRSGSEGSPIHVSRVLTPQDPESTLQANYQAVATAHPNYILTPAVYSPSPNHTRQRRANSESPMTPTRPVANSSAFFELPPPSSQNRSHGGSSRIPVSSRRPSTSSDLDARTPIAASLNKPVPDLPTEHQQMQRSPRRLNRSPPIARSPIQRGNHGNVGQGPQSPSLRANIIVPPPKISPPLRSSRPRLPVSSASTAASRAKMAEKFSALQKVNDEKRLATRRAMRPPELSDIDLKARRLRITQALSRSLEGQDLRGSWVPPQRRDISTSRTASPAFSAQSGFSEARDGVPAVVVNQSGAGGGKSDDDTPVVGTQRQDRAFSHNALDAMQGSSRQFQANQDSPTLEHGRNHAKQSTFSYTNLQNVDHGHYSSSAPTAGMSMDSELQSNARDSVYTFSDRADQESVQLVLRDTTYLDDDEAVRKGYRAPALFANQISQNNEQDQQQRNSWVSSVGSDPVADAGFVRLSNDVAMISPDEQQQPATMYNIDMYRSTDASVRSTMASDAYTIVNIVLQQHSASGIVDQQFVDDVYQRILEDSPFEDENSLSADRIEQICLREIQDREESWAKPGSMDDSQRSDYIKIEEDAATPTDRSARAASTGQDRTGWLNAEKRNSGLAPPPLNKRHGHTSSLGSAEDWLDASPSVSDWMRYAADEETPKAVSATMDANEHSAVHELPDESRSVPTDLEQDEKEDPDLYSAPRPRVPVQSTPSQTGDENAFGSATIQRPQIPRRVTSISQISRHSPRGRQSPSVSAPALGKVSTDEPISPEQRRLKQRRHVIKELVDTEFSYEKDLRVLCDIYKQTASAALVDEDIKVLFGNVEEVQTFSKDFLMLLKSLAKPTYMMERPDRKKDIREEKIDIPARPGSSASTLASSKAAEVEQPTFEKDRETRIGQAFEASLVDMEKVYTEYIKNRHAANLRLEVVQKSHGAREWLKECKENSSDITNAWNLDALLVKPVQRITKYPLLLKELIDSTAEDHPDLLFLRRALHEMTEVNMRINDVKKHAELVDQVLNRKRKDSDVRAGLSKAFGRRAEKIRQHVGITELYEDSKYNEIKIHYDNNIVQLMVVGNDCSSYGRSITKWVNKMVEIAAAAEAWVDVGHSHHQEAESKLRQFAMVVRGISTIALPDHLEQLNNKVLTPMQQAVDMMTKFKTEPKGLLQKREKRMIDYAQIKSKKDRGERIDKRMTERMEQSEALNLEAKQRMRKLVAATAKLVQACQVNLIQMQTTWQSMVRQKLAAAMGISLEQLDVEDITKEWQLDFDYQEASALSLGICNGSLLAEAVNMFNFPGSSTTLNGDESPRQTSFTGASKRSVSLASDNSYLPIPEYDPRTSGTYTHQYNEQPAPYVNPRARAQSAASARYTRTPDLAQHGSANEGFPNFARHDIGPAPRLSIEAPSPLGGLLQPDLSGRRPASSQTFFSASATPPPLPQPQHQSQSQQQPQSHPQHQSTGSSIFSSAMPMSDSPVNEHFINPIPSMDPQVLFTAASVYEFNIDRSRREAGFPYLTYVTGEIFDIIGERGELWLARNQDDPQRQIGWIWNKHFAKLAE